MTHHLLYADGTFYTPQGCIQNEDDLRKQIYETLRPHIGSGLRARVENILETMRMECREEAPELSCTRIHVANGLVDLDKGFIPSMTLCRHRLPVRYNPDPPPPIRWYQFVDELLEPMDVLTLQEFMGYCLIPTTIGQKMLMIIGSGGEGKSRIGTVMRDLLGDQMCTGSIYKVETNRFARADLENRLVMVDDDLKLEALNQTNNIKSIITAELPMDLERKGIQSYQRRLYCRFLCFGNGSIQALHDRSYGFFRRQIILTAKPRPPERVDDPFLSTKLSQEAEGIFRWALDGLARLRSQNFQFTVSSAAVENLRSSIVSGNSAVEFMESVGYFRMDPEGSISFRALYNLYRAWCDDNSFSPISAKSFGVYLMERQEALGITYSRMIPEGGKLVRGYCGIRAQ